MTDENKKLKLDDKIMKRISELVPVEQVTEIHTKPEAILGKTLAILRYELRHGNWGKYMVITVQDTVTGEVFTVSTGSKPVMAQLIGLMPSDFPFLGAFQKNGNMFYLD